MNKWVAITLVLAAAIAVVSTDQFVGHTTYQSHEITGLSEYLERTFQGEGSFAIYYEEILTGKWAGINHHTKMETWSLMKITVMTAILQKVENEELSLEQELTLQPSDLNNQSGPMWNRGAGYTANLEEFLTTYIEYSDNTAGNALMRLVTKQDIYDVRLEMGLPRPTGIHDVNKASPKDISKMFLSLYNGSVLSEHTDFALDLLKKTKFNKGLPAGVPLNVEVAHKVGFSWPAYQYHDCGIVLSENPYLLCVMTSNANRHQVRKMIAKASRIAYEHNSIA